MANSDSSEAPPAPKTVMVTAKLRCLDHRGETVNTRWGDVVFDRDGLAELELPEGEVQMLRDIKPFSWLLEDHTSYLKSVATKKPDKKSDGKK